MPRKRPKIITRPRDNESITADNYAFNLFSVIKKRNRRPNSGVKAKCFCHSAWIGNWLFYSASTQQLKVITVAALGCGKFTIMPKTSWQKETLGVYGVCVKQPAKYLGVISLLVMSMCPNQIDGDWTVFCQQTRLTFYCLRINTMTTLLMFSRQKYTRKLAATNLLDHFVMTSKAPVSHKQKIFCNFSFWD